MTGVPRRSSILFPRGSRVEASRVAGILRRETVGGALLLAAAALGLLWANSPWSAAYESLQAFQLGPAALRLSLSVAKWAADGLLAIFFFIAGLELKQEFLAGDLREPRRAAVPVAAAVGGVIVPAVLYLLVNAGAGGGAAKGWAIPTATDIAFALAVLAVIGRHMPSALRTFLLTQAVVDDLLAIVIIAVFYTAHLSVLPLLAALLPLVAFTVLVQYRVRLWWLLLPLAATTWALVHASGVHATVAGVLLGFAVPVLRSRRDNRLRTDASLAEHFEHRFRPISAAVAVPVFAFVSAGVHIGGADGLVTALTDLASVGIVVGLVIGKPLGIMAATWLVARFTRAELEEGMAWLDVLGAAMIAGIGFTVSLLIGELAFGINSERDDHVNIAVLTGSVLAATLGSVLLRLRNRVYRRSRTADPAEPDRPRVPDVHNR